MNCPKCDTSIDYRYYTLCPQCDSALTPVVQVEDYPPTPKCLEIKKTKLTPGDHLANTGLVLICSTLATVLGAVITYFTAAIGYLVFLSGSVPLSCGAGNALAFLSILLGGFLGCAGGSIFGYRNRPCPQAAS